MWQILFLLGSAVFVKIHRDSTRREDNNVFLNNIMLDTWEQEKQELKKEIKELGKEKFLLAKLDKLEGVDKNRSLLNYVQLRIPHDIKREIDLFANSNHRLPSLGDDLPGITGSIKEALSWAEALRLAVSTPKKKKDKEALPLA